MKNIVYFLGAGCSKNFGYPLTREIMPLIMDWLKKATLLKATTGLKTNNIINTKVKYEKELLDFLYIMYPGLKNTNLDNKNERENMPGIVEVLSMIDHFCFYNVPPHPAIADTQLLRFRKLLNRAVVELILEFENKAMTEEEEILFYKFIKPIKNNKVRNKITIITTNYDLLIDWEFGNLLGSNKIDCGISYRNVENDKLIFRNPNPHFHYYKLHGSLNWLQCDLCGQYYINSDGTIVGLAFEEKPDYYNTCICSNILRLKSVLVAPSLVRDIRDSNLLQIWKSALEAIRTADKVIFIGYSLPVEDFAIKSIIMRGLNGRDKEKKLNVDVVQWDDKPKLNYENLFGKSINYFTGGLANYLK